MAIPYATNPYPHYAPAESLSAGFEDLRAGLCQTHGEKQNNLGKALRDIP